MPTNPQLLHAKQKSMFAVYGDSLAEGVSYRQAKEQLPPHLRHFTNSSVIGERSSATLKRLLESSPEKGSTIVVFTGTNDLISIGMGIFRRSNTVSENLKRNVEAMQEWAKDRGVNLVFATVPPCSTHRSIHNAKLKMPRTTVDAMKDFNEWLISRQRPGISVINLSFLAKNDESGRKTFEMADAYVRGSDGLHPNSAGYAEIAKRIAAVFASPGQAARNDGGSSGALRQVLASTPKRARLD